MDEKPQFTSVNEDFSAEADAKRPRITTSLKATKKRIASGISRLAQVGNAEHTLRM